MRVSIIFCVTEPGLPVFAFAYLCQLLCIVVYKYLWPEVVQLTYTHTMAQQRSVGSHSQVPPMTLAAAGDSCQSCKAGFFPSVENKPLVWWAPQTSLRPIKRFPPCFFFTCQCQEGIRVEVIIVVVLPLFVIIIDDEFINCKYECLP